MSKTRTTAGWLALAARHRQWQVEQQMPELKESITAAQRADAALAQARTGLDAAHAARGAALASPTFGADALMRHARHVLRLHGVVVDADECAERARELDERLRTQAQGLLAERDAFQQRLERIVQADESALARRQARELDELWLLRAGGHAKESTRED